MLASVGSQAGLPNKRNASVVSSCSTSVASVMQSLLNLVHSKNREKAGDASIRNMASKLALIEARYFALRHMASFGHQLKRAGGRRDLLFGGEHRVDPRFG
jgi:hypothetical protein